MKPAQIEFSSSTKPLHPRLVLLLSLLLPGAGHVAVRQPFRGLIFIFFILVFGWIGLKIMPESASFIGRHIGAIFVYGLSVIDSYKIAKIRRQIWDFRQENHKD